MTGKKIFLAGFTRCKLDKMINRNNHRSINTVGPSFCGTRQRQCLIMWCFLENGSSAKTAHSSSRSVKGFANANEVKHKKEETVKLVLC